MKAIVLRHVRYAGTNFFCAIFGIKILEDGKSTTMLRKVDISVVLYLLAFLLMLSAVSVMYVSTGDLNDFVTKIGLLSKGDASSAPTLAVFFTGVAVLLIAGLRHLYESNQRKKAIMNI